VTKKQLTYLTSPYRVIQYHEMSLTELKTKFIMDDDALRCDLEEIVRDLLQQCSVDKTGRVHLKKKGLKSSVACRLVLSAKRVAGELENSIMAETSIQEVVDATGLPRNQVRARLGELVDQHFAEACARGSYKANLYKVREFAAALAKAPE
jgi:hypothetical protein